MNFNIRIALTKIPGAYAATQPESGKKVVVIPVDNELGIVQDSYQSKVRDGMVSRKFFNDIYLNLSAYEFHEAKYNHTHGLKGAVCKEKLQKMTEEELRAMPFVGNMSPWGSYTNSSNNGGNKAQ